MSEPIRWLGTTEAAERLGVVPRTLYRMIDEGSIPAAIAVLIMAFLGVAVWGGFKLTFDKTQKNVDEQVDMIGK